MKKFVAQLNDESYINIPADKMEVKDEFLYVWLGSDLVAMVDVSVLLMARMDANATDKR